jgi:hypothetical protein
MILLIFFRDFLVVYEFKFFPTKTQRAQRKNTLKQCFVVLVALWETNYFIMFYFLCQVIILFLMSSISSSL